VIQRERVGAGEARPHQAHQTNGRAAPEVDSTRPAIPHSGHGANQRATGAHRTRGTGSPAGDEGGHVGQRTTAGAHKPHRLAERPRQTRAGQGGGQTAHPARDWQQATRASRAAGG